MVATTNEFGTGGKIRYGADHAEDKVSHRERRG